MKIFKDVIKLITSLKTRNQKLIDFIIWLCICICTALFFIGLFIYSLDRKESVEQRNINHNDSLEESMLAQPDCTDGLDFHKNNPVTQEEYNMLKDTTGDYGNMNFE